MGWDIEAQKQFVKKIVGSLENFPPSTTLKVLLGGDVESKLKHFKQQGNEVDSNVERFLLLDKMTQRLIIEESDEVSVFEVKEEIMEISKQTDNKFFVRNLPNKFIFIDNNFKFVDSDNTEYVVKGFFLSGDENCLSGIGLCFDSNYFPDVALFKIEKDSYKGTKSIKPVVQTLLTLVDMIDAKREVEYFHKTVNKETHQKRKKRGKPPILSNKIIIKPNQVLRKYIDTHKRIGENLKYSHKFLVRGHWRHYNSDWYSSDIRGTKKWIKPFYKGEGGVVHKKHIIE